MMTCTLRLQVHKIVTSFKQLNLSYFLTLDICCWLSLKQGSLIGAASRLSACSGISFTLLHPESDLGLGVRFLCAPLCVSLLAMVIPSPRPALSGHPSLKHLVAPASALSDSDVGNFPVPSALLPSPNLSFCLSVSLSLSLTGLVTAGCPQVSAETICPTLSSPSSCYKGGLQSMGIPP